MNNEESKGRLIECLQKQLKELQLCSTDEEAVAIAEALADQNPFEESSAYLEKVANSFYEYFDELHQLDTQCAVRAAAVECWGADSHIVDFGDNIESSDKSDDSVNSEEAEASPQSPPIDSEDDGELLGDGECELCERTIKLTRHHLIPKSTWPRMKKRIWHAASIIDSFHSETDLEKKNDLREQLVKKVGIRNPEDLPVVISHATIRSYLALISSVCRPCHSAIHRIHDEWELATEFNTVERLLECDEVRKFAKYASKQRPGKYAVK